MTVTKSPGEPLESYQPLISSVLKRKKITRDPSAWISEKEFNIDMKVYNELPIDLQLELKHLVDLDTSKDSTHNKSSKMTIKSQVRSTKLNASESESVVIDFKAIFKGKHHITEWNTELNRILDMPFKEARLEFTDIRALLTRLLAVRMILEIELLLNLIIFKIDQFTDNDKVQGWTSQSLEWTNSLIQTFKLHYNSHPKELTNISKKLLSIQFTKRNESA